MGRGVASWMGEDPLPRVSLWVIACSVCAVCWLRGCGRVPLAVGLNWRRWRCVRLLCGGPNPLTRGMTALRWCLCVCEGWCGRCSSVLFLPDSLVSRSLHRCSALVSTNVSDVLPLLLSPPLLESTR
ncbi:hypothetical protein BCY84_05488 [Trypanosoma cruzi cruzi]|nr:hypothetical protein BCY84_21176 [Trypanosoma cruzi cruzi]PBJ68685.1 hypothetical protein BCY84_21172 [Trypanosoma cruzi cruzi]PBJ77884.1 hypothetical protein BCY84_05477 [Trypanosoma cruzi cruzi]PBJ77889.1 hypothetical protein BCY84_05488 [Trypanosoma cruzi cruzi]